MLGTYHLRMCVDVICAAVRSQSAFERTATAGIVRAVRFNDVVLDQRACSPSVHGQVAIALWRVSAGELDVPI